jgi:hypothetical protein
MNVTGDMPVLIRKNGIEKYVCIQDLSKYESEIFNKYYKVPKTRIKVWSDEGFVEIKYIIKQKSDKRIFCIVATSGIVKITEDSSILKFDETVVSSKDLKIGDVLFTSGHPFSKIDVNEEKRFPNCIDAVNYCGTFDYIDGTYTVSPKKDTIIFGEILKIISLPPFNSYVYNLETENHHFSVGLGDLVMHK